VALRLFHCFPGLQASLQDVFEVVVNVNRVEPLQVFLDPWIQDVATVGDTKVSEVNGTRREDSRDVVDVGGNARGSLVVRHSVK